LRVAETREDRSQFVIRDVLGEDFGGVLSSDCWAQLCRRLNQEQRPEASGS
jgi:hypothetical protein